MNAAALPAREPDEQSIRRARAARRVAQQLEARFGQHVAPEELLDEDDVSSLEHLDELDRFAGDPQHGRH